MELWLMDLQIQETPSLSQGTTWMGNKNQRMYIIINAISRLAHSDRSRWLIGGVNDRRILRIIIFLKPKRFRPFLFFFPNQMA